MKTQQHASAGSVLARTIRFVQFLVGKNKWAGVLTEKKFRAAFCEKKINEPDQKTLPPQESNGRSLSD